MAGYSTTKTDRCSGHSDLPPGPNGEHGGHVRQRETGIAGCVTLFTTYSPIQNPMSVPTRVEKR